jgi:hypothetical protein
MATVTFLILILIWEEVKRKRAEILTLVFCIAVMFAATWTNNRPALRRLTHQRNHSHRSASTTVLKAIRCEWLAGQSMASCQMVASIVLKAVRRDAIEAII